MNLNRLTPLLRPFASSRPTTRGSLRLRGLDAPVTIRRDGFSVPHIEAQSSEDAWFALGYCEAQDRAFQLELRLRTQRGTLSQVVGEKALPIDRLSRRIGFVASSRRQLPVLDADIRAQVDAFVRGINAGLSAGMQRLPLEFQLLRFSPTPWTAEDVLGVGKLVSFLLIGNWDVELARLKILLEDGPEALKDLDPGLGEAQADALAKLRTSSRRSKKATTAIDALQHDLERFVAFAGPSGGSNAWAVSGAHTDSGRPVLANDPHLEPALPAHWYLAHMRTPQWSVAGAALVGAPAIGAGHNGFAAWGVTAGLADTVNLFIEEVEGDRVKRGDGYEAASRRTEIIEIKGHSPAVEEVLETERGPIISPALEGLPLALSLSAKWLQPLKARGFLKAPEKYDFDAFQAEFAQWPMFTQNLLYADESGKIAWRLVGDIPKRRGGFGAIPLPASDQTAGWEPQGVPFKDMPSAVNPPSGFLASANNHPAVVAQRDPGARAPFLGLDWLDEYRASRITQALQAGQVRSRDDALKLQLDETTLAWQELREAVLGAQPRTEAGHYALVLLTGWDGRLSINSAAGSVFELLVREMWQRIAHARAPKSFETAMGRGFTPLLSLTTFAGGRQSRLYRHLREQPAGWFKRSWPEEIGDALDAVMRDLETTAGKEPSDWGWGRLRTLTLQHPVGALKLLAPIFNRGPYPWGGDANTISQAGSTPLKAFSNPTVIASLRFAVEPGDWEGARFSMPGGQSGDPLSPHYDDMLPLWLRGGSFSIPWSEEAVAAATVQTLQLLPLNP